MKLTFPSVVSLDLFYSISSESPGGTIKSVWKKCRPLGRQSFRSQCRDLEGFWADLREPVSVFVPFLFLWVYSYLPCCYDQIPGKKREEGLILAPIWGFSPSWQGGEGARRLLAMAYEHKFTPLFTQAGTPSILKTGTSPLHSLLWKRHTKLYAALKYWFFLIPIKPTIGIHHPKCWWMSELRVYLSNTWN